MDDTPAQVDQAAPVSKTVAPVPQTASATPRKTAPANIAPPPVAEEITPVAPPLQTPELRAAKAAPATVAAPVPPARESTITTDDTLPVAGGILGALVLAGGAVAFGRRRRRDREERMVLGTYEPLVLTSPIPVAPAASLARTGDAPLPAEFDLSRYGHHTRAAYRGPTPENPSLSLKKRLKRARFYDQRARIVMPTPPAEAVAPAEPATKPVRTGDYVTSRRFTSGAPAFRPAYQG